jgi:hypothetical protein
MTDDEAHDYLLTLANLAPIPDAGRLGAAIRAIRAKAITDCKEWGLDAERAAPAGLGPLVDDGCPACHHPDHDPGSCEWCPRCELHTDDALSWVERIDPALLVERAARAGDGLREAALHAAYIAESCGDLYHHPGCKEAGQRLRAAIPKEAPRDYVVRVEVELHEAEMAAAGREDDPSQWGFREIARAVEEGVASAEAVGRPSPMSEGEAAVLERMATALRACGAYFPRDDPHAYAGRLLAEMRGAT